MTLVRRTYRGSSSIDAIPEEGSIESRGKKGVDIGLILFLICGLFAVAFASTKEYQDATKRKKTDDVKRTLEDGVILSLEMDRKNDMYVSLGPHKARVAIAKKQCRKPRLWMRLVGAALVSIPMDPENDDKNRWSASFAFPIEGEYHLEVRWYGCVEELPSFTVIDDVPFMVKGGKSEGLLQTTRSSNAEIFPAGFWASKRKFKNTESIHSHYVWFSEAQKGTLPSASPYLFAETALGASTLAIEGNPIAAQGLYDLSSYELVCWVGSPSLSLIFDAFVSLNDQIDAQHDLRSFKYFPLYDFTVPDKDWKDRRSFRNCKIVLISVDEMASDVSQSEYKKQVEHFIQQVSECLVDGTFPIWIFTVNKSPMSPSSKMCHSPSRHTHNHPCNDALFELFDRGSIKKRFPPQVKLLDNTDLSDPQFDDDMMKDVFAAIAMRVYSLLSAQVDEWRSMNQIVMQKGLMRNGTLVPTQVQQCDDFTSRKESLPSKNTF